MTIVVIGGGSEVGEAQVKWFYSYRDATNYCDKEGINYIRIYTIGSE